MDPILDEGLAHLLLAAAAFAAGAVDAVAGGGGLILLPALLSAGLPPHLALGTNKLAGTFGTLSASHAYVRRGLFRPSAWRVAIAATAIGALLGTLAVGQVPAPALGLLLPALIVVAGLYVVLQHPRRRPRTAAGAAPQGRGAMLGGLLGFYDGFVGPGTGAFWTSAAMAVFRLDLLRASGVARAMNFVSNLVALAAFMLLGLVDYGIGLAMGASLMLGAWVGAHTAIRLGAGFIRPVFLVVVLALALRLVVQA